MSTGQQVTSTDGLTWHFEAGSESLDFVMTGDLGPHVSELLPDTAALGAWLHEREPRLAADGIGDRDLRDALELRHALERLYTAADAGDPLPGDAVDTVNLFASVPDVPPSLDGGQRRAGAVLIRSSQALSSLARDAVAVLGARDDGRIRRCPAEGCGLLFHDESRTGTRRWCSMQRCGNRAKVRAHRARKAAAN